MTENEVIRYGKDYLKDLCCAACKISDIHKNFVRMAIKALEEIQQYRAIGTVEECRAARERQKEMKTGEPYINGYGNKKAECLNCHCTVMHPANYCKFCGQKLDWSELGTKREE